MTGWEVLTGRASVPAVTLAELAALRAALPGYDVIITSHSPTRRFEAIRRHGDGPGPWCVISSDPADLWRELAPDRELAERILAIYPGTRQMVRENRRFLARALDYVLAQGITQYVDLGAGLPTFPAVHEIVRRSGSTAAVVYVDNDPVVINHLYALAASGDDHVRPVPADLTSPAATLTAIQATTLIDRGKPVCLILAMVLHFLDAAAARDLVSAYLAELAPGSHVIITVGRGDEGIGKEITSAYDAASLYNHTPEEVASFFTGLDLIHPGITDARAWQPGWPAPAASFMLRDGQVLAGVARKP